jgi:tetratricopeptide (TPR) repeat protein
VLINLVRLLVDSAEYEKAEELCRREIEGTPESFLPMLCLAEIEFRMKNTREAKEILEKAISVAQENVDRLLQIAFVYGQNGYHNNELHLYHRALTLEPSNQAAKEGIADVFLKTGHLEKTEKIVRDMRPVTDDIEVYYKFSMILAGIDSPETGEEIYKTLTRDYPYRHEAYLNLCLLYLKKKSFDAAIATAQDCLKNVLDLDPKTMSDFYTIIGCAHFSLGEVRESLIWLRKAKEFDGENEAALLNMKIIEQYI